MLFLFLALVGFAAGIGALVCVAAADSIEGQDHRPWTIWPILIFGAGLLMACGLALLVIGVVIWQGGSPGEIELVAIAILVLLLGPLGVLVVLLGLSLRDRQAATESWWPRALRMIITLYGYLLICGSPAILFPPLLGFTVAALLAGLAFVRKSRHAQMLWLLTIPVERRFPLIPELQASGEAIGGRTGRTLLSIAQNMEDGEPLSRAMAHRDAQLPPPAVLAARVGEQTGTLPEALRDAAIRASGRPSDGVQAAQITGVVTNFWAIILLLIGVVGFCMYYIVPKFKEIFEDFDVALPEVSVLVINASNLFVNWWFRGMPLVLTLLGLTLLAGECYRRGWQNLSLNWLTRWFPRLDTPDILRNLSRAVATGTPLPDVMETLAAHHHREHVCQRLWAVCGQTEHGRNPWEALAEQRLLRGSEVALLQSAETAGNLDWALRDVADRIELRRSHRLQWWVEVLRPWPVLILAGLAALFALGMFLPLVKLLNELS
jgi:type II secretory pathway component PulF